MTATSVVNSLLGNFPTVVGLVRPLTRAGAHVAHYLPLGLAIPAKLVGNMLFKLSILGSLYQDAKQPPSDYRRTSWYMALDGVQFGLNFLSLMCNVGEYTSEWLENNDSFSDILDYLSTFFITLSCTTLVAREIIFKSHAQHHDQTQASIKLLKKIFSHENLNVQPETRISEALAPQGDEESRCVLEALIAAIDQQGVRSFNAYGGRCQPTPAELIHNLANELANASAMARIPVPGVIIATAAALTFAPAPTAHLAKQALQTTLAAQKSAIKTLGIVGEAALENPTVAQPPVDDNSDTSSQSEDVVKVVFPQRDPFLKRRVDAEGGPAAILALTKDILAEIADKEGEETELTPEEIKMSAGKKALEEAAKKEDPNFVSCAPESAPHLKAPKVHTEPGTFFRWF